PENGVGMTGVYPQAVLREYDADLGGNLTDGTLIAGIEAALQAGPSVINLSVGSTEYDQALQDEIYSAVRRGSLVVAASGNSREQGNPLNFPANMSHVLTVAATDQNDTSAFFSSSSAGVDLSAPGVGILAAVPTQYDPTGYSLLDGTSFSAPMVSAAAAWVWTVRSDLDNTQLFDLMRWSARDVETPGFDAQTGFGILDIPHALTMAAPAKDPLEPNDDIYLIKPGGLFPTGMAPLTTSAKHTSSLQARLDFTEDPEDVYRIWVPGGRSVTVDVHASKPLALQIWRPGTSTVQETGAAKVRDLAAAAKRAATHQTLSVHNTTKKGAYYYADLYAQNDNPSYSMTVATPKPIKVAKR
ncbi:MAG: S8 family serine peptidase, partial [Gaiellaceae bacterium]